MNFKKRNQLSLLMMYSSMLLLLIFLFLWLRQSYNSAYTDLQEKTNLLFLNSVRDVKDDLTASFFPEIFLFNDSTQVSEIQVTVATDEEPPFGIIRKDSAMAKVPRLIKKSFSTLEKRDFRVSHDTLEGIWKQGNYFKKELKRDSLTRIALTSTVEGGIEEDITGSLSLFIALAEEGDSSMNFTHSSHNHFRDTNILVLLNNSFEKSMSASDLPFRYEVIRTNDGVEGQRVLTSENYVDHWTGDKFAVEVEDYENYLWKQLWPQILFSLLLLACIGGAFYTIYQSLKNQQRLTEIKNDFISNITHELKTPITTVGVAIEALSDFNALKNPERTKEYLQISKHELNRLSILVDKVLKMSLFEKREPQMKMEELNMKDLVEEILSSMKLQFEKFKAQIQFETSDGDFFLKGDRIHLTSVIYNLIENALKYGGEQPQIKLELSQNEGDLEMVVSDNGIGISPEYQAKIFDKFFRVPTGDAHNVKGHGLGLAYVASVIQQHAGSIKVDSKLGEGTNFRVLLPKVKEE